MTKLGSQAATALEFALGQSGDTVEVTLNLPRNVAEQVLVLLGAENGAGAVVVPVKEQFTTTEAAAMLGVSRSTLMKLIDSGAIDSVKVASHHRIPAEAIRDYEHERSGRVERAAGAMKEFAQDVQTGFQNNVTFGSRD